MEPDERLLLPPAGGRRDAGAGARLRAGHRHRRARRGEGGGQVPPEDFPQLVGRISFFVNAGIRFVTEMCKMRAFAELWDEITATRYGIAGPESSAASATACRSTRLGLTEQQPENNVYRILIEMLAVVLSKNARARAVQLPAWNEALGLPRPGTSNGRCACSRSSPTRPICSNTATSSTAATWSTAKVEALKAEARRNWRESTPWAAPSPRSSRLYEAAACRVEHERLAGIEAGEQIVVGVNSFTERRPRR